MKFETLISHSGELLSIAVKSNKSTDSLLSEYLHKKKYIGSKERKFITDILFCSIRVLSISAYCLECALENVFLKDKTFDSYYSFPFYPAFDIDSHFSRVIIDSKKIDTEIFNTNWFRLLLCSTSALIQENKLGISDNLILNHLNLLYGDSIDLKNEIIYSFCFFADLNFDSAKKIYDKICSSYDKLKKQVNKLSKRSFSSLTQKDKYSFALFCSMPLWIIEKLVNQYPNLNDVLDLCNSLKEQAPITIRVNQYEKHKKSIINNFTSQNIVVNVSNISPAGLILEKRLQLNVEPMFKQGLYEIQDEGSQLVSFALNPDKEAKVLDACAGAGGKTLHIADLQADSGKITAFDTDFLRLKELKKRALKHNYQSIVTLFNKNGILPDNFKNSFDFVLVDAPCSGMGTVRRLPLTKWRLTPEILDRHSKKQLKLLDYFSQFLKAGGILVYSTCSFMSKENDEVIANFLDSHPKFVPDSLLEPFLKFEINVKIDQKEPYKVTLLPSIYNCDGFFIARLKRIEL
ncbi:MAG: methyltransferase domain-containing protein [Candidatus Kapabacteria bacterium]|nr:methyltransferase domain-containing protein [Candidatus Kapabacteria bacterium]